MQSALEREILAFLGRLKYRVSQCDRGVVLGFLLSVVPVPPAPFIGLFISVVNVCFLKTGRIDKSASMAVKIGLLCALGNIIFLIFLYVHFFKDIRLLGFDLLRDMLGILNHLFDSMRGLVPDKSRGTVV